MKKRRKIQQNPQGIPHWHEVNQSRFAGYVRLREITDCGLKQFLQYAKDKKELVKTITENKERFYLDAESIAVISYYTNIPQDVKMYIDRKRKEGEKNMCQALIDWANDSKQEGIEEGKIEGRIEGKIEGRMELAQKLVLTLKKKGLSQQEILSMLSMMELSEEEIAQLI